jgi:benzoate membrane transport protein
MTSPLVHAFTAGIVAAIVGFAASFPIVVKGLTAVGASEAQAASGLMALSIGMGLCGIILSLRTRMPISIAWSTPGGALLATTGAVDGGWPAAIGAFLIVGALIVLAGVFKPLGRWVQMIPASLANAMLAGILFGLCITPVKALAELPVQAAAIILVWAAAAQWRRLWAIPAAVAAPIIAIGLTGGAAIAPGALTPRPEWVNPAFSLAALTSIALPLFIVTMASQNIPGLAVLAANDYRPAPGPLFVVTGLFSMITAPLGGHGINLAAITAALCASPDAHPDPAKRWIAAVVAGGTYVLFGLLAGAATAFVAASPPILIEAVAGLALLGAFASSLSGALVIPAEREAALVTFLVTASGLKFLGVGGAFWGLIAGGALLAVSRAVASARQRSSTAS